MLLEMAGGSEDLARAYLEKVTTFTGKDGRTVKGKRDITKLSEAAIRTTYGKVKQRYDEWKARRGEEAQDDPAPEQTSLPA